MPSYSPSCSRVSEMNRARLSYEAKESTVNVSNTKVVKVRPVRSLRRRILDMPSMNAAWATLKRRISTWWIRSPRSFIKLLKRLMMRTRTRLAMAMMAKASKMTSGWAMAKAGCT